MPYRYEDGVLTQKMRKSCLSSSLLQPGLLQDAFAQTDFVQEEISPGKVSLLFYDVHYTDRLSC